MKLFQKPTCLKGLWIFYLSIGLFFMLFTNNSLCAQKQGQALLDSLLAELPKAKSDTNKVKLLCKISFAYQTIKPSQGIVYAEQGIALAETLKYKKGMAACLAACGANFDEDRNYSKALEYDFKALYINEAIGNKQGMADNIAVIAFIYDLHQNNYSKALEYYNKALSINEAIGNKQGMADNIAGIAGVYHSQAIRQSKDNYPKALEYYFKASSIYEAIGNKQALAKNITRIANVYSNQSNISKTLECYFKALSLYEALGDKLGMALTNGDIASIYNDHNTNNYPKALEYYFKALSLYEELGDKEGMAWRMYCIAGIYTNQKNYPKALEYEFKALSLYEALEDKSKMASEYKSIGHVYINMSKDSAYDAATKKIYREKANQYLDSASKITSTLSSSNAYPRLIWSLSLAYELNEQYDKALYAYQDYAKYNDSILKLEKGKEFLRKEQDYANAKREDSMRLENEKKELSLKKELELQQLRNIFARKQAAAKSLQEQQQLRYEEELKRRQIISNYQQEQAALEARHNQQATLAKAAQEKKDALSAAALHNQQAMTKATMVGAALMLLIAIVSINAYRQKRKANSLIIQEKQRSENLLLNILPEEIAEELKEKGSASAKHFDEVTVLFTDFVNFTQHSEKYSPTELVASLNECFTAFDEIVERNGLEKIKTIGDAYMAVCGLPISNAEHAVKAVQAAIEIRDYIAKRNQTHGIEGLSIRIGLHSGSVVAGIIGVKKFAYDVWGDTVNFAARMESSGEEGKINISSQTFNLVKQEFDCTYRGKIQAKNKGEIDMYFVEKKSI